MKNDRFVTFFARSVVPCSSLPSSHVEVALVEFYTLSSTVNQVSVRNQLDIDLRVSGELSEKKHNFFPLFSLSFCFSSLFIFIEKNIFF